MSKEFTKIDDNSELEVGRVYPATLTTKKVDGKIWKNMEKYNGLSKWYYILLWT